MAIDLNGTVACVTGGARGIGRATAALLAENGARVFVGDVDGALAEQAAREIGGNATASRLDVADPGSFAAFLEFAGDAGPIGLLVNNAGIMRTGAFVGQDLEAQHHEIAVNLGGVLTGMRLVIPEMLESGGGHIVNVASMAGAISTPGASVYAAGKFGVVALSRAVRAELADTPVTLTTILPAAVRTDLTAGLGTSLSPVSSPASVARAIVDSCRHTRAEVGVPRWVPPVGRLIENLPESIGEAAKRLAGTQGRLTPESPEALAYQDRIDRDRSGHAEAS